MKKLLYLIPLFILLSCNPFSKKEDDAEREKRRKQAHKEWIDYENMQFQFLCEMISHRTCISQNTVIFVVKEYYIQYEYAVFEENKIIDINYRSQISKPNSYDFVKNVIKQYHLPRKEVFLIFYEIDLHYKLENIESSIDDIDATMFGIYEEIDKK